MAITYDSACCETSALTNTGTTLSSLRTRCRKADCFVLPQAAPCRGTACCEGRHRERPCELSPTRDKEQSWQPACSSGATGALPVLLTSMASWGLPEPGMTLSGLVSNDVQSCFRPFSLCAARADASGITELGIQEGEAPWPPSSGCRVWGWMVLPWFSTQHIPVACLCMEAIE